MNWTSGVTWFPYDNIVMVDDMYTYVFPGPAPAACMGNLQGRLSAESTLSICQPLTASITGGAACTAKNYHLPLPILKEHFVRSLVLFPGHQVQQNCSSFNDPRSLNLNQLFYAPYS